MPDTERIARGVYLVGGPQISHTEDATSFVIDFGGESVMIDCGTGRSLKTILANMTHKILLHVLQPRKRKFLSVQFNNNRGKVVQVVSPSAIQDNMNTQKGKRN